MTFRTRLLAAFGVVVLVPLLVFGLGIRREMSRRVAAEYEGRIASLGAVIRADLDREAGRIAARLAALQEALAADNRFRLQERAYVLDYAGAAMRLAGLDFLQVQDGDGRIVSSGHFRNEYDRLGAAVPVGGPALLRAPTAEGAFLTYVGRDSLMIGGRRFVVVGGVAVDSVFLARLARGPELAARVALPADSTAAVVEEITLPYVDAVDGPGTIARASIVVYRSSDLLAALRRNVNTWFGAAVLVAALVALLLAGWLSTRISEPLEARIAIGDLARQVNHDVKNGLAPLRNVFRHFAQVAREEPAKLPDVFAERQGTVESSIAYLETLAANYARLSPQAERKPTDVNAVVRDVVKGTAVQAELGAGLPAVSADGLVLRRVLENLIGNALDSLEGRAGTVRVATSGANGVVRIAVRDTGRGMTKPELDKAFDDFFTTKAGGTGLGLSIVRRLVLDSKGSLKVETEPGEGSTFIVELPAL
ncbi:MAG: HAMP domain-containing sensor histidine kinase [Gemmatimonadales bacterium]|nr:HAMP domain-containing sensor histidine kinase [Gemmatimonadales bacterium]